MLLQGKLPMRKELRLETCVPTWAPGSPRTSPEERVPTQQSAGQGRFQTDAQRVPVDSRCHRPPASSGCLARSLNLRARSRGPAGRLHPPTHRQRGPVCRGSPRASGGRAPGGVGGYAPQPAGTSQVGARTRGGAPGGAAPGGGAGTVAAAPAPARILARRHHRVQLGFVTGEQLCAAGPLSLPYPNSLLLEVHPAGEEADATVTDADSLCVFRCSLSRDTECCYVGKESILITLGYYSALLKFASHAEFSAFSNALRRYQCEKKEHSMFSFSRTEEVSAAQYFEFYDCLSQQQNVMRDFVMTATYHRAILQNHTDFRNKVVLDVGCGSGILSFFAVQAGALRVYAVEAGSVAQYAEMQPFRPDHCFAREN
ncbi:histone-arginine methyltransferase CARM1-like [Ovis aries]|uniref:histone-arginine methyltransferase CARM1-like n=1 Tax=Ovis aries TaxID=9940 RepID=UPI0029528033|nr:histone-arginine methyltransferase CARM1-like [Ovis aries]